MEIAPNIAVLGLMVYNKKIPIIVSKLAIYIAIVDDILPEGIGRFLVRSIKASKSFSITWLKALEAPTIQYPPKANFNKITQLKISKFVVPRTKPAIDEKTTLTARPALVIALKSIYMDLREIVLKVYCVKLARRYK